MSPTGMRQVLGRAGPKHLGQAMARKPPVDLLSAASLRRTAGKKSPPVPEASKSSIPPASRPVRPKMLTLSAVAVFAFSTYGTYLFVSYNKAVEASKSLNVPYDLSDRYDRSTRTYDSEVDKSEVLIRLGKRLKELIHHGKGECAGIRCQPERGQILLLEHGRSYYGWVNKLLDDLAPAHANQHGCWWNRDIGKIVEQSGLEIVESKRWHLGTTWKYVLRPRQGTDRANEKMEISSLDSEKAAGGSSLLA
ncbi:conserved hypothetical protein [Uncinocarpus reesii 1704]|uniref:Uncharacterized protein n=1 Tax=Uncinocarpus reesii (strain UAMH 1704) TaxID=336963 RepID=C4JYU1_UNCRE|nr:uncharacterized protein UREG_07342 [Uncinocarpus reesii 1704]EEP82477.1 conserved hypothetical protein [Uncinocarpus reesii 1704]